LGGHVPGAIHVPFWAAFSSSKLEDREPSDLLVLYCQHGPRAGIAKLALSLSGYENIIYLEGHMSSWLSADLPVEKNH
jgi:rhodanese-related sulfurtransferase